MKNYENNLKTVGKISMKYSWVAFIFVSLAACTSAPLPLSEYEGLYEYENETTLIFVAGPKREALYASINDARYPLRPSKKDIFLNSGDVEVQFVRDAEGSITGYRENKAKEDANNPVFALLDANQKLPPSIWVAKPVAAPFPYFYVPPNDLQDGLPVQALHGNDLLIPHLTEMTNALYEETYPYTQSVLVFHDGALVYEEYFYEFDQSKQHQLRSATKTLMALLAGIAIDQGLIPTIDDPVLPFFHEYTNLENLDARKTSITIRDLLTMQSGLECNDWDETSVGNESKMIYSDDWARFILDLPMANEPGTVGSYCSGNVAIIGRIIEKATGKPLKEFADEFLFEPLGIHDYQWDFRPDRSNVDNFTQAWLRPRDMMKIGVLIFDGGEWNDQRIVSSAWIEELTNAQSKIGDTPYGYFFWGRYIFPDGKNRIEIPQMSGNGGQKVIVLKEQNAVIVLTGGNYNKSSHTNELLANHILKGLPTVK